MTNPGIFVSLKLEPNPNRLDVLGNAPALVALMRKFV
jgi:hypothetical protein